ncbi:MAG: zinc ABC transporter solute-binding protein [Planctomycetes bacterium]|nr:zinc ABC transporter solute-binding protein [Planctomycetota bacterium]
MVLFLLWSTSSVHANLLVFACEPEWASLAKSLGGEHLTIYTATTNRQDPHHIQARPSLIAKARRADLLICAGAELEIGWLPLLLRKSGNANIQPGKLGYFMATDYVELLGKPAVLDRSQGDVHSAGNPHIHLDPDRVLRVATNLTRTLIKLDPSNQSNYQEKLAAFSHEWQNRISQWRKQVQPINGISIVVHHNSWIYLQQWLGLNQVAVLEPKPGIPPSSSHLSKLLSSLRQTPARMIVYSSYQNDKAANWLSQKTGIPTVALDYSPFLDETLVQWFERLINQLIKAGT